MFYSLTQRLIFIIGKGGVGRSTVSSSLAAFYAQKKERVLVVQWALSDAISPIFSQIPATHNEKAVSFQFASMASPLQFLTMNYDVDEAIREYFVDHLKMKLLYSVVVQNKHVQKLVHAAPGVAELFFLGRLFWLVELAEKEHGIRYDRIIVDTPATGHGVSLFGIAKAVSSFGITGPLAMECERVARLLADEQKTGTILVTLPEELPAEETMETYPKLVEKLGYKPLCLIVNQSVSPKLYPHFEHLEEEPNFQKLSSSFIAPEAKQELLTIASGLLKRNDYEDKLTEFTKANGVPIISIPDFNLTRRRNPGPSGPGSSRSLIRGDSNLVSNSIPPTLVGGSTQTHHSPFALIESINQYFIQLENSSALNP